MTASSWACATAATKSKASSSIPNPSSPNPASNSCKTSCLCRCRASARHLLSFSPVQVRQNRAIDFHAAPEMTETQILIRAVLMIVVVHDGHADPHEPQIIKDVHRH